jgi:hypothetical protein
MYCPRGLELIRETLPPGVYNEVEDGHSEEAPRSSTGGIPRRGVLPRNGIVIGGCAKDGVVTHNRARCAKDDVEFRL